MPRQNFFFLLFGGIFNPMVKLFAATDESVVVDHSPAAGPTGVNPAASGTYYLFLVGIFVVMWFLVIRPQKKQQREKESFLSELKVGQQVVTTGGLIGRVSSLHEAYVVLDLGQGMVKVLKSSISGPFQPKVPQTAQENSKSSSKTT